MNVALLRSNRLLALVLAFLMVATGLSALSLATSPAAHADAPLTCDSGYAACKASFDVTGYNPPSGDGDITTGPVRTHAGPDFGFLAQCAYYQGTGGLTVGGGGLPQITIYPVKLDTQAQGHAECNSENTSTATSATTPDPFHSTRNPGRWTCEAKMIDGHWTAATGLYVHTAGWKKVPGTRGATTKWTVSFTATCVYPSRSSWDIANPWSRNCIVNGIFRVYYSTSASTIQNPGSGGWGSGTLEDTSPRVYPDPRLNTHDAQNCVQTLDAAWKNYRLTQSTTYGGPLYGFYRFSVQANVKSCTGTDPEKWTNAPKTSTCGATRTVYQHVNYTYTCQASGFAKGNPDQSDDQYFEPSGCINYTCDVRDTLIANQHPATDVSVLRNGAQTNTKVGNFTVTGRGLSNVSNKQVKLNVVDGSSPYNPDTGVGVNSSNQWFKLMNQTTGAKINFNTWTALPSSATALKAGLIFYWASDPDKNWQMRQAYRFDGDFKVYRQDTVSSDPYLQAIPQPGVLCSDRTYSSHVSALRSINQVSN